jgi:predicted transposase YbfD/YdcC
LTGFDEWRNLKSLIPIEATHAVKDRSAAELRYYLLSLDPDAARAMRTVGAHRGIENSLHRAPDVVFREDESRVRIKSAAENLALARKITRNLLQQEKTLKRGIKTKRLTPAR